MALIAPNFIPPPKFVIGDLIRFLKQGLYPAVLRTATYGMTKPKHSPGTYYTKKKKQVKPYFPYEKMLKNHPEILRMILYLSALKSITV